MDRFIDLTLNGISNGAIYAAVALSLVMIWRATRILNFAQAGMLMFTTFIAWTLTDHGASYWVAFFAALAAGLVLGALVERVVIRPVEGAPALNAIIVTLGLLILIEAVAGMIWGGNPKSFPPAFSIQGYDIGGRTVLFSPNDLFTVLVVAGWWASSRCSSSARTWACRCALRRSRRRWRGCSACGWGGCSPRAGRWPRSPARSRGCSSPRTCSWRPPTSTRCSSSASPPRCSAGWRARPARSSAGCSSGSR